MADTEDTVGSTMWYVNTNNQTIDKVRAYRRGDSLWWVPSIGMTVWEGSHVFTTKQGAVAAARAHIAAEIARLNQWKLNLS